MASKHSTRFAVLFLILAAVSGFAQNATLNCGSLVVTGDDGGGLITVMSSVAPLPADPEQYLGCCIIMQSIPGTPSTSYLSASCDTNTIQLNHAANVSSVSVSARKNSFLFSPFETLVVTVPGPTPKVRKFDLFMLGQAATDPNFYHQTWDLPMSLPAGTQIYIDAYFSANSAATCASGTACIASSVWRLQGNL
ncbi:MAG TPA: hypothetical protein VHW72_01310 [Candidatus Angelobacter sp.]|jgi:hypothetical protein|nr:hypothetical protein [Candidatus Angelobacter sp.]